MSPRRSPRLASATVLAATLGAMACGPATPAPREPAAVAKEAVGFLRGRLVPGVGGRGKLALTDRDSSRVAIYDSALVALVMIRRGSRAEAGAILDGLHALARPDGGLPFSFVLPKPDDGPAYVRSGSVAWVGYAACEYLDAERGGDARAHALELARGAAGYLLARQVPPGSDARSGLVRGGEGSFRYEFDAKGKLQERLRAEDIAWVSVEHNVDAWFFLRALARVTGEERYAQAAARIADGLRRLWNPARGQLARGVGESGSDGVPSLDCASWASVFLHAAGDLERAETAAFVADAGYASRDDKRHSRGHRLQRRGPVLEGELLAKVYGDRLPARDWSNLELLWPEGSAGVALAALRVGRAARARTILEELEPLRTREGALPTSTIEVPFLLDVKPSVAATAWVELVRFELDRPPGRPTLWAP